MTRVIHPSFLTFPATTPVDPRQIHFIREQCELLEQHLHSEKPDFEFVRRHALLIIQLCDPF